MKEVYILHHQGLGDFISCNGILRFLLKTEKINKINLFVSKNHKSNVKFMYRDDKRINLIEIQNLSEADKFIKKLNRNISFIKIGFENFNKIINLKNHYEYTTEMIFYSQLDIPYEKVYRNILEKRLCKRKKSYEAIKSY